MKIIIKNNNSLVKELTINDFEEITKSKLPYVIEFYNPTCHLCKGFKPIYEKVANEYKQNFKFGTINTRKEGALTRMFGIDGVPELFIVYKDNILKLEFPKDPDPKTGFSEGHMVTYLTTYINKFLGDKE
jgi:thiol-disulfide isomerase/thioredoxin